MDAYYLNKIAEYVTVVSQLDTNALVDGYYDKYDKYDILLERRNF